MTGAVDVEQVEVERVMRERVEREAAARHGEPASAQQRARAVALAVDLVQAAGRHGVTLDDLAAVTSVPAAALDAVRASDRRLSAGGAR